MEFLVGDYLAPTLNSIFGMARGGSSCCDDGGSVTAALLVRLGGIAEVV